MIPESSRKFQVEDELMNDCEIQEPLLVMVVRLSADKKLRSEWLVRRSDCTGGYDWLPLARHIN